MARETYQTQLDALCEDVLGMGALVTEQLQKGLDALETRDDTLAKTVIRDDETVNDRYLGLEDDCIDLFVLQQPVASDLRFVAASFKISTDLERIADLVVNLAEYSIEADGRAFPGVDLREIGTVAMKMLGDAMDAYAAEDAWKCHEVASADDDLDALCERGATRIIGNLITTETRTERATEELIRDVFWFALAVRDLERIGDHAVNIAARTLYLAENDAQLI